MPLRLATAGIIAFSLTACATSTDYLEYRPKDRPQIVADRLLSAVRTCWFGDNGNGFSGYAYEPELASHTNRPRILIVRDDEPGGLPRLVIEASREKSRTSVKLFGPLLATPLGPRIQGDIKRWTSGQSDCS